jgi:hypothetical protein
MITFEDLPPISEKMQAFMDKSFRPNPQMWFYKLTRHEPELDSQLLSRGLIEREVEIRNGQSMTRYRLAQSLPE